MPAVGMGKADFIGREAVLRKKEAGLEKRMVQFRLTDPEPLLYHNEPVLRDGQIVGHLSSGAYGHFLGGAIGMGYVPCKGETADDLLRSAWEIDVAGHGSGPRRRSGRCMIRRGRGPRRDNHADLWAGLSKVALAGLGLHCPRANCSRVSRSGRGSTGRNMGLSEMKLHRVTETLDVNDADLSGSTFNDANLSGTSFNQINFSGARFNDSNMSGWHVNDVNLSGSTFQNLNLSGSTFNDANLSGTSFNQINFSGARFNDSDMSGWHVNDVNLSGSTFREPEPVRGHDYALQADWGHDRRHFT